MINNLKERKKKGREEIRNYKGEEGTQESRMQGIRERRKANKG